jgi:hypothetical protein
MSGITSKSNHRSKAPTARPIPAWGEAPCTGHPKTRGLKARPIPASIPKVALVEFNAILPQKRTKLLLKILLRMMNFLCIDIPNQRVQVRRPNRERTIPILPFELRKARRFRLQPFGGRRFYLPHQARNITLPAQSNRKVDMIGNAPNAITFRPGIADNGRKIRIQLRTHALIKNRNAILRAENHVNQNVRERLWHRRDYRPGLQPSHSFHIRTWGFAPCWYSVAPSALSKIF